MNKIISCVFVVLFLSCNGNIDSTSTTVSKDKALQKYLRVGDSLSYFDTLDNLYKVLKAYSNNDTSYLNGELSLLIKRLKEKNEEDESSSCEQLPSLITLTFEEAYRFEYAVAFCDTSVIITIGQVGDSIVLDRNLYLHTKVYDKDKIKSVCKIVEHTSRQVDIKMWKEFTNELNNLDFWGLKENNGIDGLDGSVLSATGYKMKGKSYTTVYRWCAEPMPIGKLFKKLLNITGTRVGCFPKMEN